MSDFISDLDCLVILGNLRKKIQARKRQVDKEVEVASFHNQLFLSGMGGGFEEVISLLDSGEFGIIPVGSEERSVEHGQKALE